MNNVLVWEYKVVEVDDHERYVTSWDQGYPEFASLNSLGDEGWELINVMPAVHLGDFCTAYFKRQVFKDVEINASIN